MIPSNFSLFGFIVRHLSLSVLFPSFVVKNEENHNELYRKHKNDKKKNDGEAMVEQIRILLRMICTLFFASSIVFFCLMNSNSRFFLLFSS